MTSRIAPRPILTSVLLAIIFIVGGIADLTAQETTGAAVPRIVPIDESPGHPVFHRFWRKFQRAVEARDGKFILSVISDDIQLDFGGGAGREQFIATWKPEDPKGPLWKEFDQIIRLGGALEEEADSVFSAPFAFARWPEKYNAFDYVFASGRNVRFRSKPDPSSEVIRTVSWEIMKSQRNDDDDPEDEWVPLKAHDGRVGYLHKDYVRSCIDYRIVFSADAKGGFKMDYFIAGD
jgi:hypothetical protein